jgi:hypothetical protein
MHTRFLSLKGTTIEVKHVSQSCEKKQSCDLSGFNAEPDPYPAFYFDSDPDPDPYPDPDSTIKLGHVNN